MPNGKIKIIPIVPSQTTLRMLDYFNKQILKASAIPRATVYLFTMKGGRGTYGALWGDIISGKPVFRSHPRHGHPCRLRFKARNGNCLIEFDDGEQMVTTIFNIRLRKMSGEENHDPR